MCLRNPTLPVPVVAMEAPVESEAWQVLAWADRNRAAVASGDQVAPVTAGPRAETTEPRATKAAMVAMA